MISWQIAINGRWRRASALQWAPTLTFHDQNPPITLENAIAATPTFFGAYYPGWTTPNAKAAGAFSGTPRIEVAAADTATRAYYVQFFRKIRMIAVGVSWR